MILTNASKTRTGDSVFCLRFRFYLRRLRVARVIHVRRKHRGFRRDGKASSGPRRASSRRTNRVETDTKAEFALSALRERRSALARKREIENKLCRYLL